METPSSDTNLSRMGQRIKCAARLRGCLVSSHPREPPSAQRSCLLGNQKRRVGCELKQCPGQSGPEPGVRTPDSPSPTHGACCRNPGKGEGYEYPTWRVPTPPGSEGDPRAYDILNSLSPISTSSTIHANALSYNQTFALLFWAQKCPVATEKSVLRPEAWLRDLTSSMRA